MKRKVTFYLAAIFIVFLTGSGVSMLYITDTVTELNSIINLHQIEQLRRLLIINLRTVQSNLFTAHTPLARDLNMIAGNVEQLEKTAKECSSCHHQARTSSRIIKVQSHIRDYEDLLSFYITASANRERMERLKKEAALIGETIIIETENMSHGASESLQELTKKSTEKITQVKRILLFTVLMSLVLGLTTAFNLTRSITKPVLKLLNATRMIAAGKLGATISHRDTTEFGELAENFNTMSLGLKEGYEGLQREILERIRAEEELRESRERYALAARGANDGLWDWDIRKNTVFFSSRWKAMLGMDDNEIGTSPDEWFSRIHPDDRRRLEEEIENHLSGSFSQFQTEHRMLHRDGRYRWMLTRGVALRDASNKAYRMAGSQTDITERKIAEEQLLHDAFHDNLTDLPNRALFMDRLAHAVNRAVRGGKGLFAVLFVDLDRFKIINDSLGHMAGDQLLEAVSRKLLECLRPGDTVARFGGDEFAILLEDIVSKEDVFRLIKRIQKKISLTFELRGQEVYTSLSIGIAFSDIDFDRPEDLIRNADIAMYHAKSNGRDQYQIYDSSMYKTVIDSMKLETDLRRAVDNNEFELHYQPIISLKTKRLAGFEALIRWNHPARGFILPSEFIPLAEDTGLIIPIGAWVLEEACRQLKVWQMRYRSDVPLTVSVNISGKQFTKELPLLVESIIRKSKIEKNSLILEITETVLMKDSEMVLPLLSRLKSMGVQLSIDDFGTGYSSLSYLHHFPIDALKIDRSFIAVIGQNKDDEEIVKTIADLGKNLRMSVIAEGVETEMQMEKVESLNCSQMQGFLISRPLKGRDAETFLIRDREKLPQQSPL